MMTKCCFRQDPLENDVMEHFSQLLSSPAFVPPPSTGLQQPAVSGQVASCLCRTAEEREGSGSGDIGGCVSIDCNGGDVDGDDDDGDDGHGDECGNIGKGAEPLVNQLSSRSSAQQQPDMGASHGADTAGYGADTAGYGADTAQGQGRGCASGRGSSRGGGGNGRKAGVWRVGLKHRPRRAVVAPLRNDDDDDDDDEDDDNGGGGGDADGDDERGGVCGGGSKSGGVRRALQSRVAVEAIVIPNVWQLGAETGGGDKGSAAAGGRHEKRGDDGGVEATLAGSNGLTSAAGKRRLPSFVGRGGGAGRDKRSRDAAGLVISSKIASDCTSILGRMKPGALAFTEAVVHSENEVPHSQEASLHSRVAVLLPSKGANVSRQGGGRGAFWAPCNGGKGKKLGAKGEGAKNAKGVKESRGKEAGIGENAEREGADGVGYGRDDEGGGNGRDDEGEGGGASSLACLGKDWTVITSTGTTGDEGGWGRASSLACLLAPKVGAFTGGEGGSLDGRKSEISAKQVGIVQGGEGGGKVGRGSAFGSVKKQTRRRC